MSGSGELNSQHSQEAGSQPVTQSDLLRAIETIKAAVATGGHRELGERAKAARAPAGHVFTNASAKRQYSGSLAGAEKLERAADGIAALRDDLDRADLADALDRAGADIDAGLSTLYASMTDAVIADQHGYAVLALYHAGSPEATGLADAKRLDAAIKQYRQKGEGGGRGEGQQPKRARSAGFRQPWYGDYGPYAPPQFQPPQGWQPAPPPQGWQPAPQGWQPTPQGWQRPAGRPAQAKGPRPTDQCKLCHHYGHWTRDCPNRPSV